MTSTTGPSAAEQQLIDHAQRHGLTATAKQLTTWRRAGLLPGNIPGGSLGRGKGSSSRPAPESFDLVLGLARHAGPGKRPKDLALLLFAEGLPVREGTVRAAFRAAVDTVTIPGEDDNADEDLDKRLDTVAGHLAEASQVITLVPARARRIDERIARLARAAGETWPPAELASWDKNPQPSPSTPQGATLTAASAVLTGSLSMQEIGDMLRAMNPGTPANPIASLVETTRRDGPGIADKLLEPDETLALGPVGDARDLLCDLADRAPLRDLATAWQTVQRVREWALHLCTRVENELDAGQPGDAVEEWLRSRYLAAGMAVLGTLRDCRWPPATRALDTLILLNQLHTFRELDRIVPDCQWHLLGVEGMMPPPVRDLLKDLIGQGSAPTESAAD
ncbi:hypothetical protein GCM10009730_63740 [Streptomyces albidochromogenes]|uniref:hypothetical protein n=1 Tax=Streptomyces albidochromogenes TaxID=329524 RepID=UPI00110FBA25|nr:hypothetical protein [Streptomyces albidochromogenes]